MSRGNYGFMVASLAAVAAVAAVAVVNGRTADRQVAVPSVTWMNGESATSLLTAAGLRWEWTLVEGVDREYWRDLTIVDQRPKASTRVPEGTIVELQPSEYATRVLDGLGGMPEELKP